MGMSRFQVSGFRSQKKQMLRVASSVLRGSSFGLFRILMSDLARARFRPRPRRGFTSFDFKNDNDSKGGVSQYFTQYFHAARLRSSALPY